MTLYFKQLETKINNFKAIYSRLPKKILLTRSTFNEIKRELYGVDYAKMAFPGTITEPKVYGITIEIDDLNYEEFRP